MNKEALEFYLESKNLLSQKIEEKLAEEKEGDTYSKLSLISAAHQEKQANFKENAIKFVKAHPKATENAIVGGLMGGGSELAMPSQYDMTGQPATNMSRIGKRALLGAAMGGVGGEIKSNVRGHISKLAASKEAGAWDTVKTFSKNNPFTVGLGVGDALIGANAGYVHKSKKDRNRSTSKRVLDTVSGGLVGLGMGMLHGGILDHLGRPLHNPSPPMRGNIKKSPVIPQKTIGPGTAEKGKIVEMPFGRKATSSPIPKTDKSPKGTLVQFPPPEKLAGMLSPMLQRAGGMIAKNPRAASAVLGAGAGLASNELTGADAPVFSAVAGGALGALGGKQLLRSTVNRAKPLLGKDVASGAVNVMKQNRASQLALKPPTSVNMGATQRAAAKMRPVANTQAARTLPVGKGSTNYNTTASSLPSQTSFNPTQVASNKPQTNLPGVSFREGPVASPVMPQKQDPMAGYRPSRSTIPQLAPQRGSMAKSTFDPALAQTMSKLAHIMKW